MAALQRSISRHQLQVLLGGGPRMVGSQVEVDPPLSEKADLRCQPRVSVHQGKASVLAGVVLLQRHLQVGNKAVSDQPAVSSCGNMPNYC